MGTFHDTVVDTIADWIVAARFPAGSTLPVEQAICDELDASRTTVREALKTLSAKGMVRVGPRVGTRVASPEHWNLLDPQVVAWRLRAPLSRALIDDLVELRLMIEPAAAERAARKAQPDDVRPIREAFEAMKRALDGQGSYITADLIFHEGILRAARNQLLSQLAPVIGAVLRISFELSTTSVTGARNSMADHEAVLDAIASGRPADARDRLVAIIMASRDDMQEVLARRGGGPVDPPRALEAP